MILRTENIYKDYGDFKLQDCSLEIRDGSYFVVLGLSGAGKSVLLELLAGIQKPDSGEVFYNDKKIKFSSFNNGEIGLMFQDYALFPHMNVYSNIAYPLKNKKKSKSEIENIVNDLSEKLEIKHLLNRLPETLSGGEKQRIALARILALKPKVLLLDEPLAALDIQIKHSLRRLLKDLNRQGITIVHVTHDYEEALALARHIVVMEDGKIVQQGGPAEVFKNPESAFVANFTGVKNFFKAKYIGKDEIELDDNLILFTNEELNSSKSGYVMIPQEEIGISIKKPEQSSLRNILKGRINDILPNQYGYELIVDCGWDFSSYITRRSFKELELKENDEVWLSFKASSVKYIEN